MHAACLSACMPSGRYQANLAASGRWHSLITYKEWHQHADDVMQANVSFEAVAPPAIFRDKALSGEKCCGVPHTAGLQRRNSIPQIWQDMFACAGCCMSGYG